MSKVISIVNGKGGVGKSTIASNIASYLFSLKKEVLLIDLDFQSSSLDWSSIARANNKNICDVISLASNQTERHLVVRNTQLQIDRFRKKYEYIIIDCRGAIDEYIIGALRSSDIVITPLSASALDVQATSTLLDMFEQINASKNYVMQLFLVMNNVVQNTNLLKEAQDAIIKRLENTIGMTLCETCLYRREDYKTAWGNGESIFAINNEKAKKEFLNFISELNIN